ncbi:MAG: hypothetical protein C0423_07480 [Methylibium sp.]|nr:hypothetical protein [Methylibium sp.]
MNAITTPCRPRRRAFWATALTGLVCTLALSVSQAADMAPLSVGAAMPPLSLNDQHDKPVPVVPSTQWLVFAAEKPVSDMVSAVLAAEPAGVLDRLRLVYVADISGMPALVTRMFALPKLRELPFPIALVRERGQLSQMAGMPRAAGSATLLRLENGTVAAISMARHAAELRSLLGLTASPAKP